MSVTNKLKYLLRNWLFYIYMCYALFSAVTNTVESDAIFRISKNGSIW